MPTTPRQKQWYYDNHEREKQKRREASKKIRSEFPEYRLFTTAKNRAKKFDREFTIELSDIVIPDICPVFKVPMIAGTRYAPSVDRIDSSRGYSKDNIQIISRRANEMKRDATAEELEKFADWIKQLTR